MINLSFSPKKHSGNIEGPDHAFSSNHYGKKEDLSSLIFHCWERLLDLPL